MNSPILECRGVSHDGLPGKTAGFESLSLALSAGEFILLESQSALPVSLANLVTGIAQPSQGEVLFNGQNWTDMHPAEQNQCRGRIRVQVENEGWVSNLNMVENILLSTRHHTGEPEHSIVEEACKLAEKFEMDGLPAGHPHELSPSLLRRCGWVKLGMGTPDLMYVELTKIRVLSEERNALQTLLCKKQQAGAAVMVVTSEPDLWPESELEITRRMVYDKGRFGERVLP